jgi:hypothetical protein
VRARGYLVYAGTEIANDLRTREYLRKGYGGGGYELFSDPCSDYAGSFSSPDADPAPWYHSLEARSVQFLGLTLDEVEIGEPYGPTRSVSASGFMVAGSAAGMSYGERWLTEALEGMPCNVNCFGDDLCVVLYCDGGKRMLREASIVDGPSFGGQRGLPECRIQPVEFQFESGHPYLYENPTVHRDAITLSAGGSSSTLITAGDWVQERCIEVVIEAGATSAANLEIIGRLSPDGVTCPDTRLPECLSLSLVSLPSNGRLTIDSTRRKVLYRDPITLRNDSGLQLLSWYGGFPWPEVSPATNLCLTVQNGGATSVTLTLRSYRKES